MPRRPAKIERDIPLWLIPGIVKREVSTHGEETEGSDRAGDHGVISITSASGRSPSGRSGGVRVPGAEQGNPTGCRIPPDD